ncbi:hypothetical protein PIB30_075474 [Stylosanthes scabra]|uniref:Uncharacterized protein n=1 Tax=Stylosanthes scabra TaxID=79078 RepID=A0ABU6XMX7_9FABA|nr:hypothetical protein [Stylosanthes scabra]
MEKQIRFDCLRQKIMEVKGVGPRSILPSPKVPTAAAGASTSTPAVTGPPGSSSGATKSKKKPPATSTEKPVSLEGEEDAKEDLSIDLKQKRRKWKDGIENAFSVKLKMEKELAAAKDQVVVLTSERDSSLIEQLRLAKGERLSALARMSEVEEENKVQAVELQSCRSALEQEKKKVESLTRSLEKKQTALGKAEAAADHWCQDWKDLAVETREIVQETFEILMDQVRHLNPAVDFSVITVDTLWDPMGQRIYNPKSEAKEQPEPMAEEQSEPVVVSSLVLPADSFMHFRENGRNSLFFHALEEWGCDGPSFV